jgi:tetratricopeptide (TPR) repeat protein
MPAIVALLLLGAATLPAFAQHQPATITAAAELDAKLGGYQHPITTRNPEAQKFFDQGLTLLYGFNHDEAARYFRRAVELDPDAAMPYWGLALSLGPNYNDTAVDAARAKATYDAVQKAVQRAEKASAPERDLIRALQQRYPSPDPNSDWKRFHLDYSNAMRAVAAKYPDDSDASVMFAESLMMLRPWQLWTADGKPAPGTLELVSVLEGVLRRDPQHPGANHFYIHAVEASPNLERAIPSAMRLMDLVPGAGHLVHMPGHIFLQTGDFDLAAKANERAADADKDFVKRTGATGMYPLMYWTHNIHFVSYSRAQQGRYEEAKKSAEEMAANVRESIDHMQMLEAFALNPLFVDLRFHRWAEILQTPEPNRNWKLHTAFWHYARAMAFAAQGRMTDAGAEHNRFADLLKTLPPDTQFLSNNKASPFLEVAAETLEAQIDWVRGRRAESIAHWRHAVELEANLAYDEPPAWYYPIQQSLGAALLRNEQAPEAETVFRQALERRPRDGRLLFGLWESLKAQKRASEAAFVERQFREAWADATVTLDLEDL